ncbi:MAG: sulfotransferase [Hyphomicrobiales bacterium]
MLPNHLIIAGAQKSGTTSLHHTVASHPDVESAVSPETHDNVKEIQFFTREWHRGLNWYFSHYSRERLTIDTTPEYLCSPSAISRLAHVFPASRYIVTLRDPVQRAVSQYNHYSQDFENTSSFDWRAPGGTLLDNVLGEIARPFDDWRGLIGKGLYFEQLAYLRQQIPRSQLLVLIMEEWSGQPQSTVDTLGDFLGVDSSQFTWIVSHQRPHTTTDPKSDPLALKLLHEIFQPSSDRLRSMLNNDIGAWI